MNYAFSNAIAVVPARGGSKRLPGKNLRSLGGKPLVCHTLDVAVKSECFSDVVLSSDDPGILAIADNYREVRPVLRDADWAGDKVTIFDFLQHFIRDEGLLETHDAIALLLPTAPFRNIENVRTAAALLNTDVDSVISLCRYDFPPQFGVYLDGDKHEIKPVFDPSPLTTGKTRSQDQAPILHPNGAIFIAWTESYAREGSFYRGRCLGIEMSRGESIDIDTEDDLEYAEFIMQKQKTNKVSTQ
jgi:CMP-N,N'-diacetyllegionaminic acid synthase